MRHRITAWAIMGLLVASAWAAYFFMISKDRPLDSFVPALVRLTCPVAIVGSHYPVSLYAALFANAATYALVGLIVETLRPRLNQAK
jgi:hypothetical protein